MGVFLTIGKPIVIPNLVLDKESKAWKDGYEAGLRDDTAVQAARTLDREEFYNWLDGYSTAYENLIEDLKHATRSTV